MAAYAFYLPFLVSGVFGMVAPRLAGRLPPQVAAWLLTGGGVLLAAATSVSLALLAFIAVGRLPPVASIGRWSDDLVGQRSPLSVALGSVAAVLVVACAGRFARVCVIRGRATRDSHRLAAALPRQGGELCVLDTDARRAFAVPGRPGCIVVSSGMLRELDATQRRALLAHERAHLQHRHHIHQTTAWLVAAVNPLLRADRAAVELACERWADEDAGRVCPRDVVAETLSRAAIGRPAEAPRLALCAASTAVLTRIAALQAPKQTASFSAWLTFATVALSTASAVVMSWRYTEGLFEVAQQAYRAGQR